MTIFSTRITVTTEPTLLVPGHFNPQKARLLNAGSEVVRIGGGPDVSSTDAYGLPRLPDNPNTARNELVFELNSQEEIWGIVAANTSAVNVWYQQD
jgi:hypothetical protein